MTATFQPSAASAFAIARDALRGAGDEAVAFSGRPQEAPHSMTPAPQVKPAPMAAIRTFWPGRGRPSSRSSDSVSGIEAAEVLAMWAT